MEKYKHIFGPVPSRRLGMSLGVDLVPHKVCTMDCVYCECGKTTKLTLNRKEYVLFKNVKTELEDFFSKNPNPDYITFSGAGEPTLNSKIGEVLKFIKNFKPEIPVAVLTNGSLFWDKQVRDEIMNADIVLPSLDAAIKEDFIKINKPEENLCIEKYVEGLIQFSKEFKGKIWLEILFIPDYNDSLENINKLKEIILEINPEKVQLNTLDRPGTVNEIRAATHSELNRIITTWNLPNVEIIAAPPHRKDIKSYRTDTENVILETISRRPCTLDDLSKILGLHVNEVNKYLSVLETENKIFHVKQQRGFFYKTKKQ